MQLIIAIVNNTFPRKGIIQSSIRCANTFFEFTVKFETIVSS